MTDKAISGTDSRNYDRLLPCPFCGGEPNEQHFNVTPNLPGRLICSCGAEMRQGRNQTSAELIAAWNTRACGQCEYGAVPMTEENMAAHGWAKVVRCRDCRFYEETGNCNWFECSSCGLLAEVEPDGFCAWGERKENHGD